MLVSDFDDLFKQRRIRRKLELATSEQHDIQTDMNLATQTNTRQQEWQQEALKVNFTCPGLATAIKWQSEVKEKSGNRASNKEQRPGNTRKLCLKTKADQNPKQGSLERWLNSSKRR